MDVSIWHGVLLLSGAVGANLIIDRDPVDEEADNAPPPAPLAQAITHLGQPEVDMAGHRDTLAWFLNAEEGPGALPAAPGDDMSDGPAPDAGPQGDQLIPVEDMAGLPVIEGFTPGDHVLELLYTPATDPVTGAALQPTLSIHPTADGTGSILALDGAAVAELPGVTTLAPEQVALVADQPAAAPAIAPQAAA